MCGNEGALEVFEECLGRNALERMLVEIAHQEAIEGLSADGEFQFVQKQ